MCMPMVFTIAEVNKISLLVNCGAVQYFKWVREFKGRQMFLKDEKECQHRFL